MFNALSVFKIGFLFAYFTHFIFFSPCFSECKAGLTPIFEAQMSLEIPEIVFFPSLESGVKGGFYDIVEGLITSIFRISSLVPRLSPQNSSPHYQVVDLQPSCLPTYLGLPAKCWCITRLLLSCCPRLIWRAWLIW